MPTRPSHIFFDAAGTLFRVRETVGTIYWRLHGGDVSRDTAVIQRLDQAFAEVFGESQPLLFPSAEPDQLLELERDWWWRVAWETFRRAGAGSLQPTEFERIYQYFGTAAAWQLEPGCSATLRELKNRGYPLGIISNFDSRLTTILRQLGIHRYFSTCTVSTQVGAAKPDPAIFRIALAEAGAQPARSMHIGDTVRDDCQGAQAVQMEAWLYDPGGRHSYWPGRRLLELPQLLQYLL